MYEITHLCVHTLYTQKTHGLNQIASAAVPRQVDAHFIYTHTESERVEVTQTTADI